MSIPRLLPSAAPIAFAPMLIGQGCPNVSVPSDGSFHNTTDRTNGDARFIGSAACSACHPGIAERHQLHGHAHMLTSTRGAPPIFPSQATWAGVPDPPAGYSWNDIAYVIGGYTRKASFIDQEGYLITKGFNHVDSQWNLAFPPKGNSAEFAPFESELAQRQPYAFACFVCHTTGARPQDANAPLSQDGRLGIEGTWSEPGVQCEACHGPGSKHVPNPSARNIFVDSSVRLCGDCHSRSTVETIQVSDGYIQNYGQYNELRGSGGHSQFDCTFCHDPHTSSNFQTDTGIRNDCTSCHAGHDMALHQGKVFKRGDYVEAVTCKSCHMPFATKSASSSPASVVGNVARVGDVRTHIFRINADNVNFTAMFTPDGRSVVKDDQGRAAVTVDFVCLRCHNDIGVFGLSVARASEIAGVMHQFGN